MEGMEGMQDMPGMGHDAKSEMTLDRHARTVRADARRRCASHATEEHLVRPGVGLRERQARVTYGDLHTLGGPIDRAPPQREIELHLTVT